MILIWACARRASRLKRYGAKQPNNRRRPRVGKRWAAAIPARIAQYNKAFLTRWRHDQRSNGGRFSDFSKKRTPSWRDDARISFGAGVDRRSNPQDNVSSRGEQYETAGALNGDRQSGQSHPYRRLAFSPRNFRFASSEMSLRPRIVETT
jgi:hypothetical protein